MIKMEHLQEKYATKKGNLKSKKALLRSYYLKKRAFLLIERRSYAAQKACSTLKETLASFSFVLSFYPLKTEINILSLNRDLCKEKRLLLPKTCENTLDFFQISDLKHLQKSKFEIHEPNPAFYQKISSFKNCAILVPGIVFSKTNRIGFGKGYYDYFLNENKNIFKIGVGFSEQYLESIPSEDHDAGIDELLLF